MNKRVTHMFVGGGLMPIAEGGLEGYRYDTGPPAVARCHHCSLSVSLCRRGNLVRPMSRLRTAAPSIRYPRVHTVGALLRAR